MRLESNANINRMIGVGVFNAVFCPKDEKITTPMAMGI